MKRKKRSSGDKAVLMRSTPGASKQLFADAAAAYKQDKRPIARRALERLLKKEPDHPGALHLLGMIYRDDGDPDSAISHIQRSIAIDPDLAAAHHNLGAAFQDLRRYEEAADSYRRALALNPNHAAAKSNLGLVLVLLGRVEEAIAMLNDAVVLNPRLAEAHNNLGFALRLTGRDEDALIHYRKAIALDDDKPEYHVNLADALHRTGQEPAAIVAYDRCFALRPRWPRALWARMQSLPILYDDEDEIAASRVRWQQGLADLNDALRLDTPAGIRDALAAATACPNFYLHYQGLNNRAMQEDYAALLTRIAHAAYPQHAGLRHARGPHLHARPRVGFVSSFFRHHSIGKTHGSWITELNTARFETFVYHLGSKIDSVTKRIRSAAAHFRHCPGPAEDAIRRIDADQPDVLIYPDIGMEPRIQVMAALRLAPFQAAALGHPVTSGLPSIDAFLSSELMEPPDGDEHYSERLVRLPNLSVHYPVPQIEALRTVDVGMPRRGDGPVFLCSQSLFKLLPQFDEVIPRIAQAVGPCRFWFVASVGDRVGRRFRERLSRVFSALGLDADDYVELFPQLSQQRFYALNQAADILLDSFLWSGFNSTCEAIACGLPVVTSPGPMMRGRHTAACLWRMDMPELIADDMDQYVAIAARLARDRFWRADVVERVRVRGPRLFCDRAPIVGLETFLEEAIATSGH
ncbi:MAG: tetratricopeptide repeat protein [Sedimenticolaceae bacterium]